MESSVKSLMLAAYLFFWFKTLFRSTSPHLASDTFALNSLNKMWWGSAVTCYSNSVAPLIFDGSGNRIHPVSQLTPFQAQPSVSSRLLMFHQPAWCKLCPSCCLSEWNQRRSSGNGETADVWWNTSLKDSALAPWNCGWKWELPVSSGCLQFWDLGLFLTKGIWI